MELALGFKPHTGWAIAVIAADRLPIVPTANRRGGRRLPAALLALHLVR